LRAPLDLLQELVPAIGVPLLIEFSIEKDQVSFCSIQPMLEVFQIIFIATIVSHFAVLVFVKMK
jgi:hypothetical protein